MACELLRKKAEKPVIGPIHDKSTSWSRVELFAQYYFAIFRDSSLMQITVKTFAQTRELSKTPSLHLEIEEGDIKPCLTRLQEKGYLFMVQEKDGIEAVPGRPLEQIMVAELYALAEETYYSPGDLSPTPESILEDVVKRAESDRRTHLELSFAQLLKEQA